MGERLHKILAHCGVGSRRQCETIIEQGRVTVNGRVVTKLGTKVDPEADAITVDGEKVAVERRVAYLLHKPRGYLCTTRDDFGRRHVVSLVPQDLRVYPVARLEEDAEGLLLLTNDGTLANVICHPRYQVEKTYRLTVKGRPTPDQLARMEKGVWLPEGKSAPVKVRRVDRKGDHTVVTVTVWEGRSRELRKIFGKVDLHVVHLLRTAIGPLRIEGLAPGAFRRLTDDDLEFARQRTAPGWKPVRRDERTAGGGRGSHRGRPAAGRFERR